MSIATNVDKYLLQIDGHTVSSPDGTAGARIRDISVTILADGYEPWQQEVSLYQSALEINAQLVPYVKMGTLNVSVDPEKQQVFIDEKFGRHFSNQCQIKIWRLQAPYRKGWVFIGGDDSYSF